MWACWRRRAVLVEAWTALVEPCPLAPLVASLLNEVCAVVEVRFERYQPTSELIFHALALAFALTLALASLRQRR